MYSQFFGNYLLENSIITNQQLIDSLSMEDDHNMAPPILAVYRGYVSPEEALEVLDGMDSEGVESFYDICIEKSYLSPSQSDEMTDSEIPHYIYLAQYLVDELGIPMDDMVHYLRDYESQFELVDLEILTAVDDAASVLMNNFLLTTDSKYADDIVDYMSLLFNNLIHYIGNDFTPLSVQPFSQFFSKICSSQSVLGTPSLFSVIDMEEDSAVEFASRYSDMDFDSCDEYVYASLDDFLNLHNGLYIVNESNMRSREMNLDAPENPNYQLLDPGGDGYLLVIKYSFGYVNFFFSVK